LLLRFRKSFRTVEAVYRQLFLEYCSKSP